jgi:hypothetical protein
MSGFLRLDLDKHLKTSVFAFKGASIIENKNDLMNFHQVVSLDETHTDHPIVVVQQFDPLSNLPAIK